VSPDPSAVPVALDRLQRWMQEVVVHPGTVDEAIASEAAEREIPSDELTRVVRPSRSMTSAERVGVYHGMYLLRMEEALATDYPVLRSFLGPRGFASLVRQYVERYPSRSYTLNRLGDHVPQFFLDQPGWPEASFLHDLARFELAMTQVFDEQESPRLTSDDLAAVPADAWEQVQLRPIAAFRLLELRHAVIPHLLAYHRDRPLPRPRRRATWIALYRRDYSVLRLELTRAEHDLLRALADGAPLGEALAAATTTKRSSRRQADVFRWFRTWIAEGLFRGLEVA
jgi:hypothetical protein